MVVTPFHLVRVSPPATDGVQEHWTVNREAPVLVGRRDGDHTPDIDLHPDSKVSRRHARIWHDGGWWVEDLQSKRGTIVDNELVNGRVRLIPWSELKFGETTLLFASAHWRRVRCRNLIIDFDLSPAFNVALVRTGLALISHVMVRNWGSLKSNSCELVFRDSENAASVTLSVPPLNPGESQTLPDLDFQPNADVLERATETRDLDITVVADRARTLRPNLALRYRLLPLNEWSLQPLRKHWLSLAAFVLPNHILIEAAVTEALTGISQKDPVVRLNAVYEHFRANWRINYVSQPPSSATTSQRIRMPQQVLLNSVSRSGQATCLDLALTIAACLEHVHLSPLIALVDLGTSLHALVGCWTCDKEQLEPILIDRRRLLESTVWVDPNGATQDPSHNLGFQASLEGATTLLEDRPLIFCLDVRSARRTENVQPLPISMEPQYSEAVQRAFQEASRVAESAHRLVGTVELLIGFISDPSGVTAEFLRKQNRVPANDIELLKKKLRVRPQTLRAAQDTILTFTGNLQTATEMAKGIAKQRGSLWVLEEHLLFSVMSIPGSQWEHGMGDLGVDIPAMRRELEKMLTDEMIPKSQPLGSVDSVTGVGQEEYS